MRQTVAVLCGAVALLLILQTAAGAQGNPGLDPPCTGSATLDDGTVIDPTTSSGPFEVPESASLTYSGSNGQSGDVPERPIQGFVEVITPPGLPNISLTDDWTWDDPDATGTSKTGSTSYELSSFLIGMEIPVEGEHSESGSLLCSGAITIKVTGSATGNPLFWVGAGGSLVSLGGLMAAAVATGGRP